jgi:4a-hydroxytetrahydrobiopterin dehydratase
MNEPEPEDRLTRTAASLAVETIGWRYLLGTLATSVAVDSLTAACQIAEAAVAVADVDADGHLRIDLRPDRVELSVQDRVAGTVTCRDVDIAHRITDNLASWGAMTGGATSAALPRPVQMLEVAIDAIDIAAIRPFWKAVLAYTDEPGHDGPTDAVVDPTGQLPTVWFQQMDEPRPQRNRIHFDISVAHDEADTRLQAALDAGGRFVSDAEARAFWILADAEGNEVCICTWEDRDQPQAAKVTATE